MYFNDRIEAGQQLAARLVPKYRYENCTVVAMNDGAVLVGAQIASGLHCPLTMIISENLYLPGESSAIGAIDQDGSFVYNSKYSQGELDEYTSEYHGNIEQQKIEAFHSVNQLLGSTGIISRDLLRYHYVIVVSDGVAESISLDVVEAYLKPIKVEKLIIATPLASVDAVDRMHLLADDICCLSVTENYLDTNHYYENNDIPSHEKIVHTIQNIAMSWS